MNEINLEAKYHERLIRWREKSMTQLSFFNNLLLTLAVGFLSFSYGNINLSKYFFSFKTFEFYIVFKALKSEQGELFLSMISICLSIIVGSIVALNRLYDFKITAQINQVRYWTWKHSKIKLDEITPDSFSNWKRKKLLFKLLFKKQTQISIEECKNIKYLTENDRIQVLKPFRDLRNVAHNLGISTWKNFKFQISFFILGVLLFALAQLFKVMI